MNQSIHLGKSSREKMVARADKVLNTISMSLMRDKQVIETDKARLVMLQIKSSDVMVKRLTDENTCI